MTPEELETRINALTEEHETLKAANAQLKGDVDRLTADNTKLRESNYRLMEKSIAGMSNPVASPEPQPEIVDSYDRLLDLTFKRLADKNKPKPATCAAPEASRWGWSRSTPRTNATSG